jgi:HK97 family phage prohead protease
MELEYRSVEVRFDQTDENVFSARVCNYDVPDQHKTSWAPGVLTESLRAKLPKVVWSHDWRRPIGRVTSYTEQADGLDAHARFADPDKVPDARMAKSLLGDEIFDEWSFGFRRQADEPDPAHKGVTRITRATLQEISPVLSGSVPGTRTLSVRATPDPELAHAAQRAMTRTPHDYRPTSGDGSVCATCGGLPDLQVHQRAATAAEIRDLAARIAADPVGLADPTVLLAAADHALDAAILLAAGQDLSRAEPWVGTLVSLVLAADAHADAALDSWDITDAEFDHRAWIGAHTTQSVTIHSLPDTAALGARLDSLTRSRPKLVRAAADATPKAPYGDVQYADPGYQADKQKRYPIDTEQHVRAAWSYINQADNAAKYSAENLATVKDNIKAAGKKFGITFAEDRGKG